VSSGLERFWPADLDPSLRARLEAAYDAPDRSYHDLLHLREVLTHVEELLDPDDPAWRTVVLAAWFHDAVYEGRPDDEERSAQLAETTLSGEDVDEVARLVRLTRDHRPAEDDLSGQVLCDADLAVLAAGAERYDSYVRGVRAEHALVPDDRFAAVRAEVLAALLDKPTLFHSPRARRLWEVPARANVEREVRTLRSR